MTRGLLIAALVTVPGSAAADPTQIGGFFGPRIFSTDSSLGYIDNNPAHPMLRNGVELGARIARPFFFPWFYPEFELGFAPTKTNPVPPTMKYGGVDAVSVIWLEPRVQARAILMPKRRVEPFVVIGVGAPLAISSARKTFATAITGGSYFGGGARFDTKKGFAMRFDARLAIVPGVDHALTTELDFALGLEFTLGVKRVPVTEQQVVVANPTDRDEDGIPDDKDKCPDRAEDTDGFEDDDGCPDIDNDGDHVLDIADKCPDELENLNGYEDDDGCKDTLPPEVEALKGTVEGLLYGDGETAVHDSAQASLAKIAKAMTDHPSIRIVLIGHTDDREAKAFATPVEGQPPPDIDTIATEMAHARAEAVRQAIVALGIAVGRIVVDGVGAEEPVADNNTAKGRLANRRVEIKLYVPR